MALGVPQPRNLMSARSSPMPFRPQGYDYRGPSASPGSPATPPPTPQQQQRVQPPASVDPRSPVNFLTLSQQQRDAYIAAAEQSAAHAQALDAAKAFYTQLNGPQLARFGVNSASLNLQRGQLQANHALQNRYLNQDLAFGDRQHDLQLAGVNIDRGGANRQLGYLSQLMGMNTADLNRRLGFIDQHQGLAQESAGRQLGYVDTRRGIENEALGYDIGNIQEQFQREQRSQRDDAAARGAGTSPGHRLAIEDIGEDRQYRLATRLLESKATKAGLTNEEFGVREQLARQLLGFNEQRGDLNSQYARDQLGLQNQQANTRDQLKHLDLRAQEVGLSREQMRSAIQRQLEASNLDMFFGVQDIENALGSNDLQREVLADQILRQAIANVQFFGGR